MPLPEADVVEATAERTAAGVTLTLSIGPRNLGLDEITYGHAESVALIVRASGVRLQPTSERFQGTLNGGDVIVTLPATAATMLALEGAVVVRNSDGSELERAPVPATVEIGRP